MEVRDLLRWIECSDFVFDLGPDRDLASDEDPEILEGGLRHLQVLDPHGFGLWLICPANFVEPIAVLRHRQAGIAASGKHKAQRSSSQDSAHGISP
jgi:hypothetical protein